MDDNHGSSPRPARRPGGPFRGVARGLLALVAGALGLRRPPDQGVRWSMRGLLVLAAVGGVGLGLFLMLLRYTKDVATCGSCVGNLYRIQLALLAYHDANGSFPPAYVADAHGRPMHSWRALILPHLDRRDLYDAYRFDEPWDGPNNRTLADRMPAAYACPNERNPAGTTKTSFIAVVGPHTAWPGARPLALTDILDPRSTTISLVEVTDAAIPWLEPRDMEYDRMSFRIDESSGPGISAWDTVHGAGVGFVDGTRCRLSPHFPAATLKAMLTIDGGEVVDPQDLSW